MSLQQARLEMGAAEAWGFDLPWHRKLWNVLVAEHFTLTLTP